MVKKQTKEQKQALTVRTFSGVFIAIFYVTYLLFLYFSNDNWFSPIQGHEEASFILNFFNVLMMVPVIYFVSKEICDLCFPGNKAIFIYSACALFTLTMGVSVFLLGSRYNFFDIHIIHLDQEVNNFVFFLVISLAGIVLFTIASTLVWVVMTRHVHYVNKRTRFWFPLLTYILNSFFVGFIYTTIIHSWTTYMFLMATAIFTDVFAYVGGTMFGKHKLAPKISPKKTWEGVTFGSSVTLIIVLFIMFMFYFTPSAEGTMHSLYSYIGCQTCRPDTDSNVQPYFWAIYILVTIFLMFAAISGDLFFSFIKRRFNIKDFSNLIPGHGGIIDRIDSQIFVFGVYFTITIVLQLIMALGFNQTANLDFLWTGRIQNFAF